MSDPLQLGDLEELVLLAVLRLGEDAHGGLVRDALAEDAGRSVSISTIYVTMMRLEEKGLVRSWLGEPREERGGKARRHVALEPEGLRAVHESRSALERMWGGMDTNPDAGPDTSPAITGDA